MAQISIHRPLAGPDAEDEDRSRRGVFQSTGPSRGPTVFHHIKPPLVIFQSTGPSRGPTFRTHGADPHPVISIHRPLAGPDFLRSMSTTGSSYFNPQAPRGARLRKTLIFRIVDNYFNPQAPRGARRLQGM